jgi:hypothetical protein
MISSGAVSDECLHGALHGSPGALAHTQRGQRAQGGAQSLAILFQVVWRYRPLHICGVLHLALPGEHPLFQVVILIRQCFLAGNFGRGSLYVVSGLVIEALGFFGSVLFSGPCRCLVEYPLLSSIWS